MVIRDLDIYRPAFRPDEANPPLLIDPDAVLSGAVAFQCLQRIARRTEIVERPGRVQLKQFSNGGLFDGLKSPGSDSKKHLLSFGISERPDHVLSYIDRR